MAVNVSALLSELVVHLCFQQHRLRSTGISYCYLPELGALGMVVEAVALRNSFYLDRAIEYVQEYGEEVREEDLARVSPLVREYSFDRNIRATH